MLRRFFLGHVLGVVGHAHNHQTRAAVEVVLVLIRGRHLFGFGGDIRFQNPLLLEGQIVGGVADPQQIRGHLTRLLLGRDLGLDLARARLIVIHHDARILGFEGFLDGDKLLFLQGGIQHHGSARFGHGRGGGENQHAREQESYQFLHRFEPPILFLTSTRNEPLPTPLNAGYGRIASPPYSFFVSLL